MKAGSKLYIEKDVLTSAKERISMMFDKFENICCSLSGGKDSTVMLHLVLSEATKRNRKVNVFFLDQEAEYQATIDVVEYYMNHPLVTPWWYQVPIQMKNVTSYTNTFLNAWGEGEKWIRSKNPLAIHQINEEYPDRFYPFINWFEDRWDKEKTCFFVGLRAEESLNRFRAVTKHSGIDGIPWSTATKGRIKVYPLYDWTYEDIWVYISKFNVKYNKIYDFMYMLGFGINEMRVSNLIHVHAFRCLTSLPDFEPDTYNALIERVPGVHIAARYANEKVVYDAKTLPNHFKTWKEYRDFLIATSTSEEIDIFKEDFARQPNDESVHRLQVKRLLLNAFGGSIAIPTENALKKKKEEKEKKIKEWSELL